jgi:hypothetical protein
VPLLALASSVSHKGTLEGDGAFYLVRDTGQEALFAARVRLGRFRIEAAEKPFSSGGADYPAGSWVIPSQPNLRAALESVAADLGIDVQAADAAPQSPRHPLELPRLAVLQTWNDTQSGGWARMILDDEKVSYTLIMDDDVKRGALRERFDVILFPNTGQSLKEIIGGIDPRHSPLAYTKTPEYPSLGVPTASPDITGGITFRGVQNIDEFVHKGGVLITLGGASALPFEGGIARDVSHARTKDLFTPGSELKARFRRPDHPLAYGYKATTLAFREDRTLYQVRRADEGRIVLQWGTEEKQDDDEDSSHKAEELVASGGIKGSSEIEGKPALLDIPTGKGRIIAFDFDPFHRYQTVASFRLVWNAILNWSHFPPTPPRP